MKGKPIISIFGPTAVGKTNFAFKLIDKEAEKNIFDGFDIISADSRQVYKDIAIISGADVPENLPSNVRIYGVGILEADQDWSVAHFVKYAREIINYSWKNNRLPMVVGGTGLYHQQLFAPAESLYFKPNLKLRTKLSKLSLDKLQEKLHKINSKKWEDMNNSDRNNPRRLVRAIEIALASPSPVLSPPEVPLHQVERETIILTDTLKNIKQNIEKRVEYRFAHGAIQEVKNLQNKKNINSQLLTATGVREIWDYLDGKINQEECLHRWALREFQYAKRQLTWMTTTNLLIE